LPEFRVKSIEAVTPRIRKIELVRADGGLLAPFSAGAHLDIDLPNGETRSYSLLNDPADKDRYLLGVLREIESSGGSSYVHDHLKVGDVVRSTDPINHFPLTEAGDVYVLIAGGIGITPIMSMAARLAALGKDYAVHYCARSADEAAFLADLQALHGMRLRTYFDGGDPARGVDLAALLAKRPPAAHAYVCGPLGLIRAVIAATADWPGGTVHYELFKGSEADLAPVNTDEPFDIVMNKSGRTLTVPADRTILAVLKAEGYKVKTLCTSGRCGTCRVGYLSGAVDHRDEVLDDDERSEFLQVCVSRAQPGETLVLDL
jgi:vanillate O-demethylase ferredoxin subunit